MTIVDDLFSRAEKLWTGIQGTADKNQQMKVDAAMVSIFASDLEESLDPPDVLPSDTLIYNPPVTPEAAAAFLSSSLTITAPNFRGFPVQPNYVMGLAPDELDSPPEASPAATDDKTGTFLYFGGGGFVAVTLANIRLEAR